MKFQTIQIILNLTLNLRKTNMKSQKIKEYVDGVIAVLIECGVFYESELLKQSTFEKELTKFCEETFSEEDNILLTKEEMLEIFRKTERIGAENIIMTMVQDGDLEISGVDEKGELTYKITEQGRKKAEDWDVI